RPQEQLAGLGDQVLGKAVVRLLVDFDKTRSGIDVARGEQVALRPQSNLAVADGPGKADELVDQAPADAQTARFWLNQEQAQFANPRRRLDQKHAAQRLTIAFGNPAPVAARDVL